MTIEITALSLREIEDMQWLMCKVFWDSHPDNVGRSWEDATPDEQMKTYDAMRAAVKKQRSLFALLKSLKQGGKSIVG